VDPAPPRNNGAPLEPLLHFLEERRRKKRMKKKEMKKKKKNSALQLFLDPPLWPVMSCSVAYFSPLIYS